MKYPATLTPMGNGGFVVTFRDIPEANTQGKNRKKALEMAKDALLTSMEFYFEDNRKVPMPSEPEDDEVLVELPLSAWSKVLLLNALVDTHTSRSELADKMGLKRQQVTRIVDLEHTTKLDTINHAFKAMGKELSVTVA